MRLFNDNIRSERRGFAQQTIDLLVHIRDGSGIPLGEKRLACIVIQDERKP